MYLRLTIKVSYSACNYSACDDKTEPGSFYAVFYSACQCLSCTSWKWPILSLNFYQQTCHVSSA